MAHLDCNEILAQVTEVIRHCDSIQATEDSSLTDDDQQIVNIVRQSAQRVAWLTRELLQETEAGHLNQWEMQRAFVFDLRNPINNIMSGAQLMLSENYEVDLTDDQRLYLQAIAAIGGQMESLLQNILDDLRKSSPPQDSPS